MFSKPIKKKWIVANRRSGQERKVRAHLVQIVDAPDEEGAVINAAHTPLPDIDGLAHGRRSPPYFPQ